MSANYHTDVAAGAAASAATINSPLGQLDVKLNHTPTQFVDDAGVATTVTTAATYYAVTGYEVSFTPAYTGQVFTIHLTVGSAYANTAGLSTFNLRITDSVNSTVTDVFVIGRTTAATAAANASSVSGARSFTAGAGDVGVVRKAKLYVTHTVNGTIVNAVYGRILVVTH